MTDKNCCSHGKKETEPTKGAVDNLVETAIDAAAGVLETLLGSGYKPTGRPKQAKSSFEYGDVGFNASPEVPELFVNPGAFHHLKDRYPPSLGKGYVIDPKGFPCFEIGFGGESAIGCHLPRVAPVSISLLVHKRNKHGRIGGIAPLDQTTRNQAGLSTGKENLVAGGRFPVALLDYVSMTFKKRNDLLACRNLFPVDYPAPGLVHNPRQKAERSLQFLDKDPRMDNMFRIRRFESSEDRDSSFSIATNQPGKVKQLPVTRRADGFFPTVFDLEHSFFDHPSVVAEAIARSREKRLALFKREAE
jgi:hypothetical protein